MKSEAKKLRGIKKTPREMEDCEGKVARANQAAIGRKILSWRHGLPNRVIMNL
jgi:hypothetical protein